MNELQFPIQGSCQCGAITYQLLEAPLLVAACHCKECQKLSTSAFSYWVSQKQQWFDIPEGVETFQEQLNW